MWRRRRPTLQLSAMRIAGDTQLDEEVVERCADQMMGAVSDHWMPMFAVDLEETAAMDDDADTWTPPGDFSPLVPPTVSDVEAVRRRSKRTSLGPDDIPYATWRSAGRVGAATLCAVVHVFADGAAPATKAIQ